MAKVMGESQTKGPSIVEDFMYGSNVATAHVYVRMGFLRKVYGIVTTQLLLTTIISAVLLFEAFGVRQFIQQNSWIVMICMIGTLAILFPLMIKRKDTPANYILLAGFTVMESILVGVIVSFYEKTSVLEAFVLTLGVTLGLTLYTLQSKRDFSSWGAGLFACLWVLILAGFLQLFFPTEMVDKAIAIGGALLFSLFIVFDTHMMMHKLSPEEYIMAAINLYLDIINLFLHILRLIGERRN